ncbi:MAG: hypothetical protein EOO22_12280 [Comamonadaceae bacterium]|nr:MAG: hypothetical protein EOO22_12280 [Comamonadaceae bacterium]
MVLIKTLLRLYGERGEAARWALAEAPPWDALLVDAAAAESSGSIEWAGSTSAVLRITQRGNAEMPDTLERPIRHDKLMQWLDGRRPGPRALHASSPSPAAETPSVTRYRLLRWPPSAVLRNDAHRVRLATLLSKRAFNAFELAQVSSQSVDACHAFLRLLRGTGFVETQAEPSFAFAGHLPSPSASPTASPPAPPRKPTQGFAAGLIGGLRRRLGL